MGMENLRNIGIIAHIDAGKTTFSERILFYTDEIHRMGEVHEGAATMDFMPEEQERGITIASACTTCMWNGKTINLIDTPGHVDFTVEVERSLRVLDGAIGIFCAVGGVEPQSETVWRQADAFGVPRIAVVNKMDRAGADFAAVLLAMEERLRVLPIPLSIPVGQGEDFEAILDLVTGKKLVFDAASQGKSIEYLEFSEEDKAQAAPWEDKLLDMLTTHDDALLEMVLSGEKPPVDKLRGVIRKCVLEKNFVPVFAASALRNIGVQVVLDAVCDYLPSPLDLPAPLAMDLQKHVEIPILADPQANTCALVFKILVENKRKVAFLRIYSGSIKQGDSLRNVGQNTAEKVHHLYRMHADRRESLESAFAGDIVAVVGLKHAQTGDTLTSGGLEILLEPLRSWQPVISLAFEPRNQSESTVLDEGLAMFCAEDPTLQVEQDEEGGQRVVSGMGELHLEIVRERLQREFGITPRVGNPQVVCRETVGKAASGLGTVERALGEQWHYGQVALDVVPTDRGTGFSIVLAAELENLAEPLRQSMQQGLQDAASCGVQGYALDDLQVLVKNAGAPGSGEGVLKPTAQGLYMAAQQALREAVGATVLLEPVMEVSITVPESFLGAVISLLGGRGAKVEEVRDRGGSFGQKEVVALAPMRELFGFSTYLRSATQGRAGLVMKFARFDKLG